MPTMSWLKRGETIRRFFGAEMPLVERRIVNLPVMVERRRAIQCPECAIGTLRPITTYAGTLQCDHAACEHIENSSARNAMECVIRAS